MSDKVWMLVESVVRFILCRVFHLRLEEGNLEKICQFIKFGIVGILNNLICYVSYIFLIKCGIHYVIANIVGFTASVFNSYYWNNKYVFQTDNNRIWWKTFIRTYISYAGTGIILNSILLAMWIEVFYVSESIAPLLNLIIVLPINYVVNKYWAYKK